MKFSYIIIICLSFLLSAQTLKAQSNVKEVREVNKSDDCTSRLAKAKELYAKMFSSPAAVNYRKIKKDFFDKVPRGVRLDDVAALNCGDKILLWIRDNIRETRFANYEEALAEWAKKNEAGNELLEKNAAFQQYMKDSAKSCSREEFQKFMLELMQEYGSDFHM